MRDWKKFENDEIMTIWKGYLAQEFGGYGDPLNHLHQLKMRPLGNYEPDEDLNEKWLHDAIILEGKTVDYVFDDRPKVIRMWKRRGIFVFNCAQSDGEF